MPSSLDWFIRRAPGVMDDAPNFPASVAHLRTELPISDHEDDLVVQDTEGIAIEEMFAIIEYADADGDVTRRRITMRKLTRGNNGPLLSCICHERRAFRQFRCDRIRAFISQDGEIIDAPIFFKEILDIDINAFGAINPASTDARRVRDLLRAPVSLLVIAAHSDGKFHIAELDVIEGYVEREISYLARKGLFQGDQTIQLIDTLRPMIGAMRPARESTTGYFRTILEYDRPRFERFTRALNGVVQADGRFVPVEIQFLLELEDIETRCGAELEAMFCEADTQIVSINLSRGPLTGLTVVLTGQFEAFSRANTRSLIESRGGTAAGAVTDAVDIVVVGRDSGRKVRDAEKRGIRCITEVEFLDLIGGLSLDERSGSGTG